MRNSHKISEIFTFYILLRHYRLRGTGHVARMEEARGTFKI